MKRILCTCIILAALSTAAVAQSATLQAASLQEQNDGVATVSKINELKAYLSRDSKELAEKTFYELMNQLTLEISSAQAQLEKATAEEKEGLNQLIQNNSNLMRELKPLSVDLAKNKKEVVSKLDAYSKDR